MSSGWVCVHRSMLKWEWASDPATGWLFMHLLLKANYEPSRWKGNEIGRGQLVVGRKQLAKDTGLSEQQVRTALDKLKSTSSLTIKATNRFSIITICNYDKYQDIQKDNNQQINQQPNQQATNKQPTDNQQATTSKQLNNLNKKTKKQETTIQRCAYGECLNVLLSDDEHIKLTQKYGANALNVGIDILDSWIASKPGQLSWFEKKYSSAFAVLKPKNSWVWQRVAESAVSRPTSNGLPMTKAEIKQQKILDQIEKYKQMEEIENEQNGSSTVVGSYRVSVSDQRRIE